MLSSGSSTTRTRTSGTSITASTAATLARAAKAPLQAPSSSTSHPHQPPPPLRPSAATSFCTADDHLTDPCGWTQHSSPPLYANGVYSSVSRPLFPNKVLRSDGEVIAGRKSKHNEWYLLWVDGGCAAPRFWQVDGVNCTFLECIVWKGGCVGLWGVKWLKRPK